MSKDIKFTNLSDMTVEIADEVLSRVQSKKGSEKKARNLMLNVENWKAFEKACEQDKVWPSEVLDEFISLYVERRKMKPES